MLGATTFTAQAMNRTEIQALEEHIVYLKREHHYRQSTANRLSTEILACYNERVQVDINDLKEQRTDHQAIANRLSQEILAAAAQLEKRKQKK